jgi:hypothetical protein
MAHVPPLAAATAAAHALNAGTLSVPHVIYALAVFAAVLLSTSVVELVTDTIFATDGVVENGCVVQPQKTTYLFASADVNAPDAT